MVEASRPWRISFRRRRKLGRVTVISLWLHLTVLALFMVDWEHRQPPEEEGCRHPRSPWCSRAGPKTVLRRPSRARTSCHHRGRRRRCLCHRHHRRRPRRLPRRRLRPPRPLRLRRRRPPLQRLRPPHRRPSCRCRPPPPVAMVIPRPTPLPKPAPRPPAAIPRPAPRNPDAFPTPMNFSFSRPPQQESRPVTRASSRAPMTMDFSLAPRAGASSSSPFAHIPGSHSRPTGGTSSARGCVITPITLSRRP